MPRQAILLLTAALLLAACAELRPLDGAAPPRADQAARVGERAGAPESELEREQGTESASASGLAAGASPAGDTRQPQPWRSAEQSVVPIPPPGGTASDDEGLPGAPEGDPFLRSLVAGRCATRPSNVTELSLLRGLVADLYADGVDPGFATDALLLGRCGDLADIVTEMVARGGESAALPVIDTAIALAGPEAAVVIERAAAEGLMLAGRERVAAQTSVSSPLAGSAGDYAMLYFPLGGTAGRDAEQAAANLGQLLGQAQPGYGIYTYILAGDAAAGGNTADRLETYQELLRVIETYVLADTPGPGEANSGKHTFLMPVHSGRAGAPLAEQTGPELAGAMRDELTGYLRRGGQGALAARLATSPGPFLISSLEPRLVPGDPQASRMLVDLSDIGPEYMYSVVDAYDRPIAPGSAGRFDSLLAIRGRLTSLFSDRGSDRTTAAPADDWVFLLGRRSLTGVLPEQSQMPRLVGRGD